MKNTLTAGETTEDDCRCEKCENVELLLLAVKTTLAKVQKHDLSSKLSGDGIEFVSSVVCSVKDYDYCNDSCENCPGKDTVADVTEFLRTSDIYIYIYIHKWILW